MIKYFTQLWNDYVKTQQALADMGIVQVYLPLHGVYTYVDKELFQIYEDKLREKIVSSKSN